LDTIGEKGGMDWSESADIAVVQHRVGAHFNVFIHSYPQPVQVVVLDKTPVNSCNPAFFQIQGISP
jgi:hypothetical protein